MTTRLAAVTHCIVVVIVLLFAGACAGRDPQIALVQEHHISTVTSTATPSPSPTPSATATYTPTSKPTRTPTSTPTPTSTSTPTPRPTPRALPVAIYDDLREVPPGTVVAQPGATCGVVDQLDFPLEPPEGNSAVGGGFGLLRGRYEKYHAGEDLGLANGQNFGAPVYSIGHGRVTYAQPLGWGADQGVVILEHTFSDGSTILSFYGHLHPPSIVLQAGDCVARGEQVGAIGRPRTPPHLHFEIRSHTDSEPGPGYWAVDPATAGWEPPSQYIWNNRMAAASRVWWMWPSAVDFSKSLGMLDSDTLVVIAGADLVGIDALDGQPRWRQLVPDGIADALIDAGGRTIYAVTGEGELQAYSLSAAQGGSASGLAAPAALSPVWSIELEPSGPSLLMPLPQGGVAISFWEQVVAVDPQGQMLWETDLPASPSDWVLGPGGLLLTTRGRRAEVWSVGPEGPEPWDVQIGGGLVVSQGQGDHVVYVFDRQAIYRLDTEARTAELLLTLPLGFPGLTDLLALSDGTMVALHADGRDRRILAFHPDGSLRWHRSYATSVDGTPRLLLLAGRPYVLFQQGGIGVSRITLYAVDPATSELTRLFAGGTDSYGASTVSAFGLDDDRIAVGIRGAGVLALDVRLSRD